MPVFAINKTLAAIQLLAQSGTQENADAVAGMIGASLASANTIVEHTTKKGSVLRGVVRTDLSYAEAKAIDEYTFKKDGGWFIREKHLGSMQAKVQGPIAKQEEPLPVSVKSDALVSDTDNGIDTLELKYKPASKKYKNPEIEMSAKDGAKLLKQTLTKTFPDTKFSVVMSRGTGYGSADVSWVDGASYELVDVIVRHFKGKGFNGSDDSTYYLNSINPEGKVVSYGLGYIGTSRGYSKSFLEKLKSTLPEHFQKQMDVEGVTIKGVGDGAYFDANEHWTQDTLRKAMSSTSTGHYGFVKVKAKEPDIAPIIESAKSNQMPNLMQDATGLDPAIKDMVKEYYDLVHSTYIDGKLADPDLQDWARKEYQAVKADNEKRRTELEKHLNENVLNSLGIDWIAYYKQLSPTNEAPPTYNNNQEKPVTTQELQDYVVSELTKKWERLQASTQKADLTEKTVELMASDFEIEKFLANQKHPAYENRKNDIPKYKEYLAARKGVDNQYIRDTFMLSQKDKLKGENNVSSPSNTLESNSNTGGGSNTQSSVENSNVNGSSESGRVAGSSIDGLDARGRLQRDSGVSVPKNDGSGIGTASDSIVSNGSGQRGIGKRDNASNGGGGDGVNEPRSPIVAKRDTAIIRATARDTSTNDLKLKAQLEAEGVSTKWGDADNINKALPYLLPEQRDDVTKAEKHLLDGNKNGILFTNGTGTGKTFTGLGIAKRFANAGKKNILIVSMNDKIIRDFVKSAKTLNLDVHQLDGINDNGGANIVATTYANFGQNIKLGLRDWDLIIVDEAHNLMQGEKGENTEALRTLHALSGHHAGFNDWAEMRYNDKSPKPISQDADGRNVYDGDELAEWAKFKEPLRKEWEQTWSLQPAGRTKVIFLSATPFSYVKTLEWGEGYLFDFVPPKEKYSNKTETEGMAYNSGDNREKFYMSNFGYKMRTNRLTRPDGRVDVGILERKFAEKLKNEGAMSGRDLSVPFDYDRKFVMIDSDLGKKIDEGFKFLWSEKDKDGQYKYGELLTVLNRRFDYLSRIQLLEAIKADAAIDQIKKHLALGRKVIVFHDYNVGGGTNPFVLTGIDADQRAAAQYEAFQSARPDLIGLELDLDAPITALKRAFPQALLFNGTVSKSQRSKNADLFNSDDGSYNLLIAQSDAAATGISLHDTTGIYQRVIINIGMPAKPAKLRQTEGRIYRVGQASNAIQRYLTTGTDWERSAFAQKIAERAETVDNLAQGESAVVSIKDALVRAYESAEHFDPSPDDGIGGKAYDAENSRINALSPFDRAKTDYWVKQKVTAKRGEREGKEWYATPEPVGLMMVKLAGAHSGDDLLEPSAGDGAIGRYMPSDASVTMVEPSESLASRARMNNTNANVVVDTFENHGTNNKYDAIVMNPPFGNGGAIAINHLTKSFEHLREGGRVVALLPVGAMDKLIEKYKDSGYFKDIYKVADIALPSCTFENAGTKVNTRIVVFEKHSLKSDASSSMLKMDLSDIDRIDELFHRIEDVNIQPRKPRVDEALAEYGIEIYPERSKYIVSGEGLKRKDITTTLFGSYIEKNSDGNIVEKYNRGEGFVRWLKDAKIPTLEQFNSGLTINNMPIKYRSPVNKYNIWDGLGDMPDWLLGFINYNGKKLEDFAVGREKAEFDSIDDQAHESATSPHNDIPEPTLAQKIAGNYKVGKVTISGLSISIENPKGSTRSGVDADGNEWSNVMQHHYGYVNGSHGADGDHVDVFVKPNTSENFNGNVYVVDQKDPLTGEFDEHKAIIGASSEADAKSIYLANYEKDWDGLAAITALPMAAFKPWVLSNAAKQPLAIFDSLKSDFDEWYAEADMPVKDKDGTWVDLETGIAYSPKMAGKKERTAYEDKRLAESKAIRVYAKSLGGKALKGSIKQVAWAESLRADFLRSIGDDDARKIAPRTGDIEQAKFWIDNRNTDKKVLFNLALSSSKEPVVKESTEKKGRLESEKGQAESFLKNSSIPLSRLMLLEQTPAVLKAIEMHEAVIDAVSNAKTKQEYADAFALRSDASRQYNLVAGNKTRAYFEELQAKKDKELQDADTAKLKTRSVSLMDALTLITSLSKKKSEAVAQQLAAAIGVRIEKPSPTDFTLSTYTEVDLRAQEAVLKAAEANRQANEKAAKDKAIADKQIGDFRLSGSSMPSDVAASYGQNDMFVQTRGQSTDNNPATQTEIDLMDAEVARLGNVVAEIYKKHFDWRTSTWDSEDLERKYHATREKMNDLKRELGIKSRLLGGQQLAQPKTDHQIMTDKANEAEARITSSTYERAQKRLLKETQQWGAGKSRVRNSMYDDLGGFTFTPAIALNSTLDAIMELAKNNSQANAERLSQLLGVKIAPKQELDMFGEPIQHQELDMFGDPIQTESPIQELPRLAIEELPLGNITLSDDVPQFKSGADDDTGVVEPLGGKFDRTGVAPIQVWRRLDGRLEVISGRHRLDLATRSGEKTIPAQVHNEADGFDAKKAGMLDAELNIRDGQGKVRDYVDYFTHSGVTEEQADERGLLARSIGQRAFAIASQGSEELLTLHRNEMISDQAAADIATLAPNNSAMQAVGLRVLQDNKPLNNALNTIRAVMALTREKGQEPDTFDLFGFDGSALKEAESMAKIASRKQRQISEQLTAIKGAVKNPKAAAKHGVFVKNQADALEKVKTMTTLKSRWDNWSSHADLLAEVRQEIAEKGGYDSILDDECFDEYDSLSMPSMTDYDVVDVDTIEIKLNPTAYQWRNNVTGDGTEKGRVIAGTFNYDDQPPLILHRRLSGRVYLADGHHRFKMAKASHAPIVKAIVLDEHDGYTVPAMRVLCGFLNLRKEALVKDRVKLPMVNMAKTADLVRKAVESEMGW